MDYSFTQLAVLRLIIKSNVEGLQALSPIESEVLDALSRSCDVEALAELGPYMGVSHGDPVVKFTITACMGFRP